MNHSPSAAALPASSKLLVIGLQYELCAKEMAKSTTAVAVIAVVWCKYSFMLIRSILN